MIKNKFLATKYLNSINKITFQIHDSITYVFRVSRNLRWYMRRLSTSIDMNKDYGPYALYVRFPKSPFGNLMKIGYTARFKVKCNFHKILFSQIDIKFFCNKYERSKPESELKGINHTFWYFLFYCYYWLNHMAVITTR